MLTNEQIRNTLNHVFKDKNYNFDKVNYVNARTKIVISCPIHGDFLALYDSLRKGHGCRICGYATARVSKSYTNNEFIEKVKDTNKDVNGDSYDYSKTNYINRDTNITITCAVHGDFVCKPANHLNNNTGCPECGKIKSHSKFRKPIDKLKEEIALVLDPEKYTLVNADLYVGNKSLITMNCKEHGNWTTKSNWILSKGYGCAKCSCNGTSRAEVEVYNYIKSLGFVNAELGNNSIISPLEIDIVVESKKLCFEYDGMYYHSEKMGKTPEYHLDKTVLAKRKGYKLIHVYEDEWLFKHELTKKKIAHILGVNNTQRVFARKLFVDEVSYNEAKDFFNTYHIQGSPPNHKVCYGLFDKGVLVAAMSFGTLRFNINNPSDKTYELYRYATSIQVVGGFSKLISVFKKNNYDKIDTLYSFSDKRWSSGGVYLKCGFSYVGHTKPSYDYTNSTGRRFNRQNFMKQRMPELVNKGIFKTYDPEKTEVENCKDNGFYRIWNCGMDRWKLKL